MEQESLPAEVDARPRHRWLPAAVVGAALGILIAGAAIYQQWPEERPPLKYSSGPRPFDPASVFSQTEEEAEAKIKSWNLPAPAAEAAE